MNKEFVPYQESLELKELGFDEKCFGVFQTQENNRLVIHYFQKSSLMIATHLLPAPTFSQAFRWFREKYELHSYIEPALVEKANSSIKYDYVILENSNQNDLEYNNLPYHTYKEAELACLKKLIEIVKKGNK